MRYNTPMEEKIRVVTEWLGSGSINIFGLPFAGKDTHGAILAEQLGGTVVGGGEILRSQQLPQHVKEAMDRGDLVPIEDYLRIVIPYLSQDKYANHPIILSTVGRWKGEEGGIIEGAEKAGHPIKAVIYLQIDPIIAYQRWAAAATKGDRDIRADDNIKNLDNRFKEFMSKTLPVIEEYRRRGLLIEIDGRPPVETVNDIIIDALLEHACS